MKALKFIMLVMTAFAVIACEGQKDMPPIDPSEVTEVVLEVSTKVIVANGMDKVNFTVKGNGYDMTRWAKVYCKGSYEDVSGGFATTKAGIYEFWAEIGSTQTPRDKYVSVEAVEYSIPNIPSDPQPGKTSFVKRAFVLQFTGTGCGYCPWFIAAFEELEKDAVYKEKYVLAAAHTYPDASDPMYINEKYLSRDNYPYVLINNSAGLNYSPSIPLCVLNLKSEIDKMLATPAQAGIAVNSTLTGNSLTATVQLKSAKTQKYAVSCWIVEDGITAKQANYDNVPIGNIHNATIRACTSHMEGKELGTIEAGKTAETVFSYSLKPEWKKENCRMVIFITLPSSSYKIDNCISAPLDKEQVYQYL